MLIDRTPTFSGTAPVEASFVDVGEAGEVSFPCTNVPVQPDGTWSCESSVSFADGTYQVYVVDRHQRGRRTVRVHDRRRPSALPRDRRAGEAHRPTPRRRSAGSSAARYRGHGVSDRRQPVSCGAGSIPAGWIRPLGARDRSARARARTPIAASSDRLARTDGRPEQRAARRSPIAAPPAPPPGPLRARSGSSAPSPIRTTPAMRSTITGRGLPVGAVANAEIHSTPQWVGSADAPTRAARSRSTR